MDLNTNNQNMGGGMKTPPQAPPKIPPTGTPPMKEPDEGSAGPIVGSIIIIIIIVLGGLYFLNQRAGTESDSGLTGDEIRLQQDNATLDLNTQSASDELADIESDLNSTELGNLDEELDNILGEF